MGKGNNTNKKIYGIGDKPQDLLVQKSLPLFNFTKTSFSIFELRILDIYLSRIDSHKPDIDTVIISKKELEYLLFEKENKQNKTRFNIKYLLSSLDSLIKKTVICDIKSIQNPQNTDIFYIDVNDIDEQINNNKLNNNQSNKKLTGEYSLDTVPLFEKATIQVNVDTGNYEIILKCSSTAKPYIFNIEEIKYIRYKLRNILKLKTLYSIILFIYLEQNKFRKKWTVSIEELKSILGCSDKYESFKEFNRSVLQPAIKNVLKTERQFTFNFVRSNGNTITHIEFNLINDSYIKYNYLQEDEEVYDLEYIFKKEKYAQTEIDLIQKELLEIPIPKLMEYIPQDMNKDNIDIKTMQYFYAKHCYNILEKQKSKKEIANELKYYLTILKNNYKDNKEVKGEN